LDYSTRNGHLPSERNINMSSSVRGGAETIAEIVLNIVIRGRIASPMRFRRVSSLGCLVASPLFVVVDPAGTADERVFSDGASFLPSICLGPRTLDLA